MKFHVITPLARYGNVPELISMLENQNVTWHVITDHDSKETFTPTHPWIIHHICPNDGMEFWKRCNHSINWFIENCEIIPDDMYCFMNDDDGYHPQFFKRMRYVVEECKRTNQPSEVIICSMERGHTIPDGLPPERRHPTHTLIAHPRSMHVGHVGVEQIFLSGRVLFENRFPIDVCGDGMMITDIVNKYPTTYAPQLYVLFNYLEPGRWNK